MADSTTDPEGLGKKQKCDESVTLEEALDIAGFGKYSYSVVFAAGVNVLGSISTTLLLSYILPATDCDLNLTTGQKGFLSSLMLTGMLCTTHLFGVLADEYGRKYISMRCNIVSGILTLATAFCPDFTTISIVTFLNGLSSSGVIIPAYIYVGESIPLRYRPSSIMTAAACGNVSNLMIPGLAIWIIPVVLGWSFFGMTINSWRLLIAIISTIPITGAILFSFLNESPKFLLTKGLNEQTMEVLRRMYTLNSGRPREEYPVQSVRLDAADEENQTTEKTSMKRVLKQTLQLFRKPHLKNTLFACTIQAGTFAATNIIYLWLPQIVNQMITYSQDHPEYGVTFCHVLQTTKALPSEIVGFDAVIVKDLLAYDYDAQECEVNVPATTYHVATLMGAIQLVTFGLVGWLSHVVGGKRLLVINIHLCGILILASTWTLDIWTTIACMIASGVIIAASIPIAVGIIMGMFPTSIRSTASCLTFFTGRGISSLGMQVMAALQGNYCDISYWGLGVYVMAIGVLTIFGLPNPRNIKK